MDLSDKVALITGSAKGIGRAAALRLGRAGATVCVNSRKDIGGGKQVAALLQQDGCQSSYFQADVSKEDHVEKLVQAVVDKWGGIDILVNNAGISGAGPGLLELTGEDWDRMLTMNLKSMFLVARAVLPRMIEAGSGKIVNLSSTGGTGSIVSCNAHYAAAKGGIVSLTRRMARDFAAHKINVNCVAPGLIHDTGFNENMPEDKLASYTAQIPLGRPGYVKDVSGIIAFLCSEEADFITGQIIVVDGGATC